jgi:hypothetical protein
MAALLFINFCFLKYMRLNVQDHGFTCNSADWYHLQASCKWHYQNAVSAYCSDRNIDTRMPWRYIGRLYAEKERGGDQIPRSKEKKICDAWMERLDWILEVGAAMDWIFVSRTAGASPWISCEHTISRFGRRCHLAAKGILFSELCEDWRFSARSCGINSSWKLKRGMAYWILSRLSLAYHEAESMDPCIPIRVCTVQKIQSRFEKKNTRKAEHTLLHSIFFAGT